MRVLSIVHHDNARAGVFGEVLGTELIEWNPSLGDSPPPLDGFEAVMVFGGAMHVDQEAAHPWLRSEKELIGRHLEQGTPLLGVCLGAQLVAEVAGARPHKAAGAGDRLAPGPGHGGGPGRPSDRAAGARVHGFPVALL